MITIFIIETPGLLMRSCRIRDDNQGWFTCTRQRGVDSIAICGPVNIRHTQTSTCSGRKKKSKLFSRILISKYCLLFCFCDISFFVFFCLMASLYCFAIHSHACQDPSDALISHFSDCARFRKHMRPFITPHSNVRESISILSLCFRVVIDTH